MFRSAFGFGLVHLFTLGLPSLAYALPEIGPGFPTDPSVGVQSNPGASGIAVASDGSNVFTVFEESGNIRGMLVDAERKPLLDAMPFYAEATEQSGNYYPSLAFGGGRYLMAWTSNGVWAELVGLDGKPAGEPMQLSETGYYPAIAWVGVSFVVVWQDFDDAGRDIAGSTVSTDGSVSPPTFLTSTGTVGEPSIAALGSLGVLVAWADNPDTMNTAISAVQIEGSLRAGSEPITLRSANGVGTPEVVSDGTEYLVAWTESGATSSVDAVTVGSTGTVSDLIPLATLESVGDVSLGVNDSSFIAVWKDYSPADSDQLGFQHVSAEGELLGGGVLNSLPTTANAKPALLGQTTGYWVSYEGEGVWGATADDDLSVSGDPVALSLVPNSQNTPYLSFDGSQYTLVWADERDGSSVFSGRAVRVNQAGRVLDTPPLAFTDATDRGSWFSTASAGAGKTLVGWLASDDGSVHFRVLSSDGSLGPVLDAGSAVTGGVTVASDGTGYLAVYAGSNSGQFLRQAFDASGAAEGDAMPLSVPADTYEARVLGGQGRYLLVLVSATETQVASLGSDGTIGTPETLGSGSFPVEAVAGGGKTVLVWAEADGTRVARFWGDGTWAGDAFTLGMDGMWGQTAWDGQRFAAVWQDSDYYAHWTTFDAAGTVSPVEDLFVDQECNSPALVSNAAGQLLLSCIRYDADYSRRLVNYLLGQPLPDSGGPAPDVDAGAAGPGPATTPATTEGPVVSEPGSSSTPNPTGPATGNAPEPSLSTPQANEPVNPETSASGPAAPGNAPTTVASSHGGSKADDANSGSANENDAGTGSPVGADGDAGDSSSCAMREVGRQTGGVGGLLGLGACFFVLGLARATRRGKHST